MGSDEEEQHYSPGSQSVRMFAISPAYVTVLKKLGLRKNCNWNEQRSGREHAATNSHSGYYMTSRPLEKSLIRFKSVADLSSPEDPKARNC